MYGFSNGSPMLRSLCLKYDIILLQEHWLLESNLNKISNLCLNFQSHCLSSMNNKASAGIIVGRPFGGTAILWHKRLANRIQIIESGDTEGKIVSIKLRIKCGFDIIITCVYLPCVTSCNDYIVKCSSIYGYLENLLTEHAEAEHIVGGDFNFEFADNNVGFNLFKDILSDYSLICCDDKISNKNVGYTYVHESLNQQSWLDHFVVTKKLDSLLSQCDIIDAGNNLSDHLPISCSFKISQESISNLNLDQRNVTKRSYKERWDKADLISYYMQSGKLLQSIVAPVELLHCTSNCRCNSHIIVIEEYYKNIVNMLKRSSAGCVPKMPCNCLKAFWNDELDRLKTISIDMHVLWRSVGSPRHGIINAARLTAKLDYKQAIKQAEYNYEQNNADELNQRSADMDSKNFWKTWNAKYKHNVSNPTVIDGQSDPTSVANLFRSYYSNVYVNSSNNNVTVDEFRNAYSSLSDCNEPFVLDIETVERCITNLKTNKAAGLDGIVAEHVINSHPAIAVHLKLLFTMMIMHAFVPDDFDTGVVIPLVKDKHSNINTTEN